MLRVFVIGMLLLASGAVAQTAPAAAPMTVEAKVCTGVQERMPVGMAESFSNDVGQVYLWCKVTGASDPTTINVVWLWEGKEMTTVPLEVKGSSWRTWAAKRILEQWIGKWEARIVDPQGNILTAVNFAITAAAASPQPTQGQ